MALDRVGVQAVVEGLGSYKSGAGQITAANQQMAGSAEAAAAQSQLASMAFMAVGAAAVAAGGMIVGMAVKTGIGMASMLEQSEISFKTMLGSEEKAKQYLHELYLFAAVTPFQFAGLVQSTQRLLAMGFAAEEIIPDLRAIGDAAAALGAGQFGIDRMVRALGQMKAKGKVSAEEMMQLAEMGVPAWQMLADVIGTDIPTAMKRASAGAIASESAVKGLIEQMTKRYGGMMEQQSTTLSGLWSTFQDTTQMAMANAMKPLLPMLKKFIIDATALAGTVGPTYVKAMGIFATIAGYLRTLAPLIITLTGVWAAHRAIVLANVVATRLMATTYGEAYLIGRQFYTGAALGMMVLKGLGAAALAFVTSWTGIATLLIGVNFAVSKLTGSSLLAWLGGAAQGQREYNKALKEYGDIQKEVTRLVNEGMKQDRAAEVANRERTDALKKYGTEAKFWADETVGGFDKTGLSIDEIDKKYAENYAAQDAAEAKLRALRKVIMDEVKPSYMELLAIIGDNDVLMTLFAKDLADLKGAFDKVQLDNEVQRFKRLAEAMGYVEKAATGAADALKKDFSNLKSAADTLTEIFVAPDPMLEYLKLEQKELENTKTALGNAWSPEQETRLKTITAQISLQQGQIEILGAKFSTYGAVMAKQLGKGAGGAAKIVDDLADTIASLPEEERIKIGMLLPTMQMTQLLVFLAELDRVHNVQIALQLSTAAQQELEGQVKPITEMFAGRPISYMPVSTDLALKRIGLSQDVLQQVKKVFTDADTSANDLASGIDSVGGAAEKATEPVKTFFDILKDRADAATGALDSLRNALSSLFGRPTKETAAINVRLAGLKLQRAQMIAGGSTDKQLAALDKQIASVQQLLDVRQAEQDVIKSQMDLADQTLQSDKQQVQSAWDLVGSMGTLSGAMLPVITLYDQQQTAMEKWRGSLIALLGLSGLPIAEGSQSWLSFQHGGFVPGPVGQPQLAVVHGGERVSPPSTWASVPSMLAAGTPAQNYAINVNAQGATAEEVRRLAHSAIDEAFSRARSDSYRSGAPLSSGVG